MVGDAFLVTANATVNGPPERPESAVTQGFLRYLHPTPGTCIPRNFSDSVFSLVTVITLVTRDYKSLHINRLRAPNGREPYWLQLVALVTLIGTLGASVIDVGVSGISMVSTSASRYSAGNRGMSVRLDLTGKTFGTELSTHMEGKCCAISSISTRMGRSRRLRTEPCAGLGRQGLMTYTTWLNPPRTLTQGSLWSAHLTSCGSV
jgi:hypothetical protein